MEKKYTILIVLGIIVVFLISLFISYNIIIKEEDKKQQENTNNNIINIYDDKLNSVLEDVYKEININSAVAQEIFEFLPKTYQTYPMKMTDDYMIYEAITRLSKDENIETIELNNYYGYKYEDVNNKLKEIYGDAKEAVKKSQYVSPIEYFEKEDVFCLYPYSFDNTDNIMVLKSIEENSTSYKVIVYSLGVYVDVESNSYDSVYLITKSTMGQYYAMMSRNNPSIVSTYKKYELNGEELDPEKIIEKYGDYLPQIEFDIEKLDDRGTKYYISDIKDIY